MNTKLRLYWCQQERCWRDQISDTLYRDGVILEDVKLEITEGYRTKCRQTGMLGFASGTLVLPEANILQYDPENRLSFNGKQFFHGQKKAEEKYKKALFFSNGKAVVL